MATGRRHAARVAMDVSVVNRARAGDREAFAVLAREALPWMDGVARLTLRDPELARDAVQEALVRAWKGLPGLRDPAQLQAWLRRLVVRACIDELRRTRGRFVVEVALTDLHHPEILDTTVPSADRDALERAFQRLDPVQRSAVALYYYLDLPVAEVAAALDMPEGSVKSVLSRSRGALRAALEADARPGVALQGGLA